MKGHATDEIAKSGRVQKRGQIHNDISDQDATKGIEDHGDGVVALAEALANKQKAYTCFMARIHCVMIAAHRAATQSRKAHETPHGKMEKKRILVPRKLGQAQGHQGEYLRVQRIPDCFIPPKDNTDVANVTKFMKAYRVQQAPPLHPGISWLELLI